MTCPHCLAMRERLDGLLGLREASSTREERLRLAYPEMKPAEVRITLLLFDAAGAVVGPAKMERAASKHPEALSNPEALVKVQIHRMRSSLGEGAIQNVWAAGYRLTPSGLAKISEALEAHEVAA